MLKSIPQESLIVRGFDMEYPVYENNSLVIVYSNSKKTFSLRIKILDKNQVLVSDNYPNNVRTPINKVRKNLKAYFKAFGYKTLYSNHA